MGAGLSIDRLFQRFGEIRRPADANHDHRRTLLAALSRRAARNHVVSPMRAAGERQNAFLQIDHHQRGFFALSSNMVSPYLLLLSGATIPLPISPG
jgi:hypothetical protein